MMRANTTDMFHWRGGNQIKEKGGQCKQPKHFVAQEVSRRLICLTPTKTFAKQKSFIPTTK
jgi:hypothetical protein